MIKNLIASLLIIIFKIFIRTSIVIYINWFIEINWLLGVFKFWIKIHIIINTCGIDPILIDSYPRDIHPKNEDTNIFIVNITKPFNIDLYKINFTTLYILIKLFFKLYQLFRIGNNDTNINKNTLKISIGLKILLLG